MRIGSFLSDVAPDESFYCPDGTYIRNVYELLAKLDSGDTFRLQISEHVNDISEWIDRCIGDQRLVESLKGVTDHKRYAEILRKRIKRLEKIEGFIKTSDLFKKAIKKKAVKYGPVILILILVYFGFQMMYIGRLHTETRFYIRNVDTKMDSFIIRQTIADNILFKHLLGIEYLLNLSINRTTFDLDYNLSESAFIFTRPRPPKDRVERSKIVVTNRSVVLFLDDPSWSEIADTKSMEPVLNYGSHAFGITPESPEGIIVGDIISFTDPYGDSVIHRIIEIGQDEAGWYAVTKGDANMLEDPFKVRFGQVKRVLVAIVY